MRGVLSIFLLLLSLSSLHSLPTIDIECIYEKTEGPTIIEEIHSCRVKTGEVTQPSTTISNVINKKPENLTIEGFVVTNGTLNYLPTNIDRLFSILKLISVKNSNLQEINREDLAPFPKLTNLNLSWNKLKILDKNLFIHNPELISLQLNGNQIFHMDSLAFNGLQKVNFFNLNNNTGCRFTGMKLDNNTQKILTQFKNIVKFCFNLKFIMKQDSRIEKEVNTLKNKIKDVNRNASRSDEEVKKLKIEVQKMSENIEGLNKDVERLERDLSNKNETISELRQNLTEKIEKILSLNQNLKELEENIQNLNQTIENQSENLTELESLKTSLEDHIEELDDTKKANEEEISALKLEISQNKIDIQNFTTLIQKLNDDNEKESESFKANHSKVVMMIEECKEVSQNLTDHGSKCVIDLEVLSEDLKSCNNSLNLKNSQLVDLTTNLSLAQNHINALNSQILNLTHQLEESNLNNTKLAHQIESINCTSDEQIHNLQLISDMQSSDVELSHIKFHSALAIVGILGLIVFTMTMMMYCKKRSYDVYKMNLINGPKFNHMSIDGLDVAVRNAGVDNPVYDDGQVGEIMEIDSSLKGLGLSEQGGTSSFKATTGL